VKAVVFDGAIPRYLATRAAGAVSKRALTGPGRCTQLRDIAPPALPGDKWVRVATRLGGVCGSDLNLVSLHVSPSTSPFSSFPFVIGHENVGVITEVGSGVTRVLRGARVVVNPLLACAARGLTPPCRGCADGYPSRCERFTDGDIAPGMLLGTTRGLGGSWGESFVAHESQVCVLPEGLSDRTALLTEPFACALSPVLEHPPAPGSRVLVIGAGSVGLLTAAALRFTTDAEITVLARHGFQADHAERIGVHHVVRPQSGDYYKELARLSGGRLHQPILGKRIQVGGFDATFVCVGSDAAVDDALRFTRSGGFVGLLGNVGRLPKVDWTPLWLKELTVHGSLCYNHPGHGPDRRDAFGNALRILSGDQGRVLEPLVSHVVGLSEWDRALAVAMGRKGSGAVKVAISVQA